MDISRLTPLKESLPFGVEKCDIEHNVKYQFLHSDILDLPIHVYRDISSAQIWKSVYMSNHLTEKCCSAGRSSVTC